MPFDVEKLFISLSFISIMPTLTFGFRSVKGYGNEI